MAMPLPLVSDHGRGCAVALPVAATFEFACAVGLMIMMMLAHNAAHTTSANGVCYVQIHTCDPQAYFERLKLRYM